MGDSKQSPPSEPSPGSAAHSPLPDLRLFASAALAAIVVLAAVVAVSSYVADEAARERRDVSGSLAYGMLASLGTLVFFFGAVVGVFLTPNPERWRHQERSFFLLAWITRGLFVTCIVGLAVIAIVASLSTESGVPR